MNTLHNQCLRETFFLQNKPNLIDFGYLENSDSLVRGVSQAYSQLAYDYCSKIILSSSDQQLVSYRE